MEARRQQPDDPRSGQDPEHRDQGQHRQERGEYRAGQLPGVSFGAKRVILGEDRDERRRHRALGEQLTEQVRNPVGDKKRIRGRGRAEQTRENHVSDKAEDAAGKRGRADQSGGLCEGAVLVFDAT